MRETLFMRSASSSCNTALLEAPSLRYHFRCFDSDSGTPEVSEVFVQLRHVTSYREGDEII